MQVLFWGPHVYDESTTQHLVAANPRAAFVLLTSKQRPGGLNTRLSHRQLPVDHGPTLACSCTPAPFPLRWWFSGPEVSTGPRVPGACACNVQATVEGPEWQSECPSILIIDRSPDASHGSQGRYLLQLPDDKMSCYSPVVLLRAHGILRPFQNLENDCVCVLLVLLCPTLCDPMNYM